MAEHPSKKARVNEPDWSAELAEAKSDYRAAKESLDGEFQKNSPNQGYVDHLKQTLQDAQKRIELLLQRQSQQPEDVSVLQRIHEDLIEVKAEVKATCALQMKMATVSAVTESAAATQTRGTAWHRKVVGYFDFHQCMVLSQLFPDERGRPSWFNERDAGDDFRRAQGPFPAVAEHIIPKGDISVGKAWQVDVHEECNDGPSKGMFEIFVSQEIREDTIMYYPIAGEPTHRVKVGGNPLQFKSLHGQKIEIIGKYQANPSLRSLFLKAEMAHRVDRMLPHPATRLKAYQIKCGKMNQPNWTIWQKSVPDRSLPVVQEVHDD
ncbi:unnamed protein product [Symbiodinium sp. CCMP2592]|nr:unnamed protein product [Symbiodinium sp. CCMP2592]